MYLTIGQSAKFIGVSVSFYWFLAPKKAKTGYRNLTRLR